MYTKIARTEKHNFVAEFLYNTFADTQNVFELREADRSEVLTFLALRPVHTVVMTSFINDNGLTSELNRGKFYGYRNANGSLEGVALIGHSTLVEARSENAIKAFAAIARETNAKMHLIMSDGTSAERFWQHYSQGLTTPRLTCTEKLFELSFPFMVQKCEWNVRLARAEEVEQIAEAQAEVAFIESGVNPLERDREGFLKRVMRRIEQGRVYVVFENDKLVFKADVVAETAETAYLEGVYVAEEMRGTGIGSSCLSQVGLQLLDRVANVSLLSNVEMKHAHKAFAKAGFKSNDTCVTLFV